MAGGLYIGIDVSKDSLEVAFGCDGEVRQLANRDHAITALAAELKKLGPELVVMEASGGYERMVTALLWEAALPVVVANPACGPCGQPAATDSGLTNNTVTLPATPLFKRLTSTSPRTRRG